MEKQSVIIGGIRVTSIDGKFFFEDHEDFDTKETWGNIDVTCSVSEEALIKGLYELMHKDRMYIEEGKMKISARYDPAKKDDLGHEIIPHRYIMTIDGDCGAVNTSVPYDTIESLKLFVIPGYKSSEILNRNTHNHVAIEKNISHAINHTQTI